MFAFFKIMKKVGQQAHMVLCLSCVEKLLRLWSQYMSVVVSGMGWNPFCRHFSNNHRLIQIVT